MDGALASQPCERAREAEGRLGGDSTSRDETKPRPWEGKGVCGGAGGQVVRGRVVRRYEGR